MGITKNIFKKFVGVYLGVLILCFGVTVAQQTSTFTDSRDGKTYRMVTIGNQIWMAENLNFQTDNSWCFGDDESNCDICGRLYDWYTARTACPDGWWLPRDDEWAALINATGDEYGENLKSRCDWYEICDGTDEFGFSALPCGIRNSDGGSFGGSGEGRWWTDTGYGATIARGRGLSQYGSSVPDVPSNWYNKKDGLSVRCIRDD